MKTILLYNLSSLALPVLAAAKKQASTNTWVLVLATTLLVLASAAVFWLVKMRSKSEQDSARALFRELCRAHQLSSSQINLLRRLAVGLRLQHPGVLFMDSSVWRIPEDNNDTKGLSKKDWDKLQAIQRILFMPAVVTR